MTPEERKDIAYFLAQFPDYRVQYGPMVVSLGGEPFSSMNVVVWMWKEEDVANTARMFSGDTLQAALGNAAAELGGDDGYNDLQDYYARHVN